MTMIHVTQKHINKGLRSHCRRCPVALAIQDAFPDKIVSSGFCNATIDDKSVRLPSRVSELIWAFDIGGEMTPFSFEVNL